MEIKKINMNEISVSDAEYDFFETEHINNNDLYRLPVISGTSLVWGHNIARNAADNGNREIYCRFVTGNTEYNLITALKAENRPESYSWFEKEKILDFMKKNNMDLENNAVLSQIQYEGSFVPNTEKFAALDPLLKNIVSSNIVDLKTAGKLEIFDEETVGKIAGIIKNFSFSRKRLFINYIVELYKKGNRSREDIIFILESAEASDNPFDFAALKRYPELKKLEEDFLSFTEKNLKGSGIQLKSPPNFEGGSFTVQFSFKSKKQLGRIIERLEKVRERSDEIFRLL